jgi:CRP/FNR family transcriptional regulator
MFMTTAIADDSRRSATTSPLFAHLTPDEQRVFLAYGHTTTAPAGTLICARGSEQDCLYVVQAGSLLATEAAAYSSGGAATRFTAGQVVGETAFLDGPRSDTQLTTDTYSEVWILRSSQFDRLLQEHPRIAGKVALGLARIVSRRKRTQPKAEAKTETRQLPLYAVRPDIDLLGA